MRICVAVRVYPAETEGFVREQVEALVAEGHHVDLLAVYQRSGLPTAAPRDPAPQFLVGPSLSLSAALLRGGRRALLAAMRRPGALARSVLRWRPGLRWPLEAVHALHPLREAWGTRYDVIHAHFGPTANLLVWLRELGAVRGPLLTTFHGFDVTVAPADPANGTYELLFERGERFTVNSRFLQDRLISLGAPPGAVEVLPVGVDTARFRRDADSVVPDAPRLLTVARLVECKGIDYALRAVQRLAWDYPGLRYTIVGDGPLRARLERLGRLLGVSERVRFLGSLPYERVVEEYARHDIFVLPGVVAGNGHVEAQGRVLLEAQAAGLMVVASDAGGMPEVVAPDAGIIVATGDDQAVVGALRRLLARPDEWEQRRQAGRVFVEERFRSEDLHRRLLEIYRELSAGGAP